MAIQAYSRETLAIVRARLDADQSDSVIIAWLTRAKEGPQVDYLTADTYLRVAKARMTGEHRGNSLAMAAKKSRGFLQFLASKVLPQKSQAPASAPPPLTDDYRQARRDTKKSTLVSDWLEP